MKEKIHDTNQEIFCSYCNGSIEENETYIVKDGREYHYDCWEQMNTKSIEDDTNEEE